MSTVKIPKKSWMLSITILAILISCVAVLVLILKGKALQEEAELHSLLHDIQSDSTGENSSETSETGTWNSFRLPRSVVPLHYDLQMQPDLLKDVFSGSVDITVDVLEETDTFLVHAHKLDILSYEVTSCDTSGQEVSPVSAVKGSYYDKYQFFVLQLQNKIDKGLYKISFKFSGELKGTMIGYYKTSYKNEKNESRHLATTKFQPTYARHAFPCFDEPSFRSTFNMTLLHEPEYIALSNMPVLDSLYDEKTGLVTTKFMKSPPMVTYLLCFIVCDFKYTEVQSRTGMPIRVYAQPNLVDTTKLALEATKRLLEYFEDYLSVEYSLPKLDMVAIPEYISKATEHWGVVTFDAEFLLYDPDKSDFSDSREIVAVISHELVHMWFGDLVAYGWWDDTWLAEGFASYLEFKGLDQQFPDWESMSLFATDDYYRAMMNDRYPSSDPIVKHIENNPHIPMAFSTMTYAKGASVLRMLERILEPNIFRSAISDFVNAYSYKTAETANLWDEIQLRLEKEASVDFVTSAVMKSWTEQPNYPYVSIERNESYTNGETLFTLTQFPSLFPSTNNKKDQVWSIPVWYETEYKDEGIIWLQGKSSENLSLNVNNSGWVKFNKGQLGFYVVDYSEADWRRFTDLLMSDHEKLSPLDRNNLLHDSYLLAVQGVVSYEVFLNLTRYLRMERHPVPWETALRVLLSLQYTLEDEHLPLLKAYTNNLYMDIYKELDWKPINDSHKRFLQRNVVDAACRLEEENCLKSANAMLWKWAEGEIIPENLRKLTFRYGLKYNSSEEIERRFVKKFMKEQLPGAIQMMLITFRDLKNPEVISDLVNYIFQEENIDSEVLKTAIFELFFHPPNRALVSKKINEKWPFIVNKFTINNRNIKTILRRICNRDDQLVFSDEVLKDCQKHKGKHHHPPPPSSKQILMNSTHIDERTAISTNITAHNETIVSSDITEEVQTEAPDDITDVIFEVTTDTPDDAPTTPLDVTTTTTLAENSTEERPSSRIGFFSRDAQKCTVERWLEFYGPSPWLFYKLPFWMKPEHYEITLHPRLDDDFFTGSVLITVDLLKPSRYFILHSVDLKIGDVFLKEIEADNELQPHIIEIEKIMEYREDEKLVISTKTEVPPGKYNLYIDFEGPFTLSLKGLYKSSYVHWDTVKRRYLATTQFQPTHARKAFPCFDEPRYRTTFDIKILHDPQYKAISNARVKEVVTINDTLQATVFERTLPMVTYLLAIAVCDFDYRETVTANGVEIRAYSDPHLIDKTEYGLEAASAILTHFENYFDISFPLQKLDLIAVPDFGWNGMENWGLVMFSEAAFLCDSNSSSITQKRRVLDIVGHELAHMWFGDLVTMNWWSDLWLNEGFARYMQFVGASAFDPQLYKDETPTLHMIAAMRMDQYSVSHPVVQKVVRVTGELFDVITYEKGESVLRMLESYMKEDFRTGVSNYLKEFAYRNAETKDLWNYLSNSSAQNLDVQVFMEGWTTQQNYPVVTVKRKNETHLILQQQKFLRETVDPTNNYVWYIPLAYRTALSVGVSHFVLNTSEEVPFVLHERSLVKFNTDFTGFYSVNYPEEDWEKLTEILHEEHLIFSTSDRMNLLFDAFQLAAAGQLNYSVPLEMSKYLKKEHKSGPWIVFLDEIKEIRKRFKGDEEAMDLLMKYLRSLSEDLLADYSWEVQYDPDEKDIQRVILHTSCTNRNEVCLNQARDLFINRKSGERIYEEFKPLILQYGMGRMDWRSVWNIYLSTVLQADKDILLDVMAVVDSHEILHNYMKIAADRSVVRKHKYFEVLEAIAENPEGFDLVVVYVWHNWEELKATYGELETSDFLSYIFSFYTSQEDLDAVEGFFEENWSGKPGNLLRKHALEDIRRNINWIKNHKSTVMDWLNKNAS